MAITREDIQVTWPTASNTYDVTTGSTQASEAVTIDATATEGMLHLYTDNQGTAGSGDTVDFYILYTGGDPIGSGSDVYDTEDVDTAILLAQLDTNQADPLQRSVPLPSVAAKAFKIFVKNNSGDTIRVACGYTEKRAA